MEENIRITISGTLEDLAENFNVKEDIIAIEKAATEYYSKLNAKVHVFYSEIVSPQYGKTRWMITLTNKL